MTITSDGDGPRQCIATKANGRPCHAHARRGSEYCVFHDPETAADAKERQRRGGRAGRIGKGKRRAFQVGERGVVRLAEVDHVLALLEIAAIGALELEPGPERVRALVGVATAALRAGELAREWGELPRHWEKL